jgi:hypothetical protein
MISSLDDLPLVSAARLEPKVTDGSACFRYYSKVDF